jgi:hypothetical protein
MNVNQHFTLQYSAEMPFAAAPAVPAKVEQSARASQPRWRRRRPVEAWRMCTKPAISEDTGRDGGCERGARTGHCPRTTRVDGISLATWTVGSQSHGLPPPPLASARPGSVPAGLRAPLACVRCPPPRSRHPAPGPPKRDVPGGAAPTSSVVCSQTNGWTWTYPTSCRRRRTRAARTPPRRSARGAAPVITPTAPRD